MKTLSEGQNHRAINIGSFSKLNQYSFKHPKFDHTDKSRLFVGELLKTSGSEISFRELARNTSVPFLHKHNEHEEIYIFLKGSGKFQVDESVFKIEEGSIVKVAPHGSRTLSNESGEVMIYIVVQAKANSLAAYNVLDGLRVEGEIRL